MKRENQKGKRSWALPVQLHWSRDWTNEKWIKVIGPEILNEENWRGWKKKSSEKLSCSRRSLDAGHKNLKNTLLLLDEKFPDAVLRKWNGRPYLSSTEKLRYSAGDKTSNSSNAGNDLHLHNTQIINSI